MKLPSLLSHLHQDWDQFLGVGVGNGRRASIAIIPKHSPEVWPRID